MPYRFFNSRGLDIRTSRALAITAIATSGLLVAGCASAKGPAAGTGATAPSAAACTKIETAWGPFQAAERTASLDGGQLASWLAESLGALTVESAVIDYVDQPGIQQFSDDLDALSRKISAMGRGGSASGDVDLAQATVDADCQGILAACG